MKRLMAILLGALYGLYGLAHEGHGIPGALPPAPHGGVVQEAEHKETNLHKGKEEEAELFFEAVYKGKDLKVYPLALLPGNANSFVVLSPIKDLTKIAVQVEFPRTKKTEVMKVNVNGESIQTTFDAKGANRFMVHVTAEHGKELKAAKLQIETN